MRRLGQVLNAKRQLPALLLQRIAANLAHTYIAIAAVLVSDAYRPIARCAHQHHVADRDRALLLRDAALDVFLRVGTHVLLYHHHVLHQDLAPTGHHAQHASLLTLVSPGDHLHLIVAANVDTLLHSFNPS